jgi:hypothetical protein
MDIDWKKIGLWVGGISAVGVAGYWLYQYQQAAAANAAANDAASANEENQALAALTYGASGVSNEPASVSGPSVDTGNDALQTLINSILNPTTGTVSETPTTPTPTPTPAPTPAPVNPVSGTGVLPTPVGPSPAPIIAYPSPVKLQQIPLQQIQVNTMVQ